MQLSFVITTGDGDLKLRDILTATTVCPDHESGMCQRIEFDWLARFDCGCYHRFDVEDLRIG